MSLTLEKLLAARDFVLSQKRPEYPRVHSYDEYLKLSKELKMSEEVKQEVTAEAMQESNVLDFAPKRESISKTMVKKIRALTKDQLVDKLIAIHNYAEAQKAANMVLMFQVKQLNEKLNGKAQEVPAETTNAIEEVKNEGI